MMSKASCYQLQITFLKGISEKDEKLRKITGEIKATNNQEENDTSKI